MLGITKNFSLIRASRCSKTSSRQTPSRSFSLLHSFTKHSSHRRPYHVTRTSSHCTPVEQKCARKSSPKSCFVFDLSRYAEQLDQNVPADLSKIQQRVDLAKNSGLVPDAADSLQVFLSYLRQGLTSQAMAHFLEICSAPEIKVFHYELLLVQLASKREWKHFLDVLSYFNRSLKNKSISLRTETCDIILIALGECGNVQHAIQIYEDMFRAQHIPTKLHLINVLKAASVSGDPKTFHQFFMRLNHKSIKLSNSDLRILIDLWGTSRASAEWLNQRNVNTADYACVMDASLRAHNYKVAINLFSECRELANLTPDSLMYETFLSACIRDNQLRMKAREWKKKFHRYPKGVEDQKHHYDFVDFLTELSNHLGDSIAYARPAPSGEQIKFSRTTRKASKQLYKFYPKITFQTDMDQLYEWVPEYTERKERAKLALEQEKKAVELERIQEEAKKEAESLGD